MVEISQNETRVLRTLIDSGGKSSLEDLSKKSGLADSAVARAVLNLSQNQLVNERVEKETELSLTDEGRTFARVGLPERIILLEVKNHGGRLTLKEALQHSKLAEKYGSIATGWINRKKWGTIEKSGPDLVIVARSEAETSAASIDVFGIRLQTPGGGHPAKGGAPNVGAGLVPSAQINSRPWLPPV